MFACLFPLQAAAVLDTAKADLRTTDKTLAIDLGFDNQADYSKAKHSVRPLGFQRFLQAPTAVQWAILRAWRVLLLAESAAPQQAPDADLLDELAALIQRRRQPAKATLRDLADERKSA